MDLMNSEWCWHVTQCVFVCLFVSLFCLFLETGPHCVALAGLELIPQPQTHRGPPASASHALGVWVCHHTQTEVEEPKINTTSSAYTQTSQDSGQDNSLIFQPHLTL